MQLGCGLQAAGMLKQEKELHRPTKRGAGGTSKTHGWNTATGIIKVTKIANKCTT